MSHSDDQHLSRLAGEAGLHTLRRMRFDWDSIDSASCAAMRLKRSSQAAPDMVAFLGGASSGKSTLFNSLLGREVSCISAHAHETLGPVIAVHEQDAAGVEQLLLEGLFLPGYEWVETKSAGPMKGEVGSVHVFKHTLDAFRGRVIFDMPDFTSKLSADEGAVSCNLLPWFDTVIVVVDEERWFDAAVFETMAQDARRFGPQLHIVFNRTENAEPLTAPQQDRLIAHAATVGAGGSCVSSFASGCGYRPVDTQTCGQLHRWISSASAQGRNVALIKHIHSRCARVVAENVSRKDDFDRLCRDVEGHLGKMVDDTSLSLDLLTDNERSYLGLGHQLLPLYGVLRGIGRRVSRFGLGLPAAKNVDFEKRTDDLAEVLRQNLKARFRHATDRIDELVSESPYLDATPDTVRCNWLLPQVDAEEWALRIRGHIDAWKKETSRQARTGDMAAMSIGLPLLLADILFLGGAGITVPTAVVWLAGFFGGKGVSRLLQRSPAFNDYQATVRSYQALIRESLIDQWQSNRERLPKLHLKMNDPLLESLMYWSVPGRK